MKQIIKSCLPQLILDVHRRYKQHAERNLYSNKKFKAWWNNFKETSNLESDLINMVDTFLETDAFEGISKYWNYLNKKNLEQISESGVDNFRQTVATNYYTWINGIKGVLGANFFKDIENYNLSVPINEIVKKHDYLKIDESILFNAMTVLLYDYVNSQCPEVIEDCDEGDVGNPPTIKINGKKVSQDILSSAIEYSSIIKAQKDLPKRILEIGAGSGRTAEFFLKKHEDIKYVICDIVPALYVSQFYLTKTFKDKQIFKFREFENYSAIKDDFENSSIAFIMPHQLDLLPSKHFDTFMAIDCLHEMKKEKIADYFKVANRLGKYFYFKAWKSTDVPFDNITLTEDKYIPLKNWKEVFKRDCYVPSNFFEAMYSCDS
ncbi:putative sugar O-methyltransferase [Bacteriovoracales bacterium]|nr:putative sugar O-methyltransferase [Bacteriovoracales bacterium]